MRNLIPMTCLYAGLAACGETPRKLEQSCVPSYDIDASPLAAQRFVRDLEEALCARRFSDCPTLRLCQEYASLDACVADAASTPVPWVPEFAHYDAEKGAVCLNAAGTVDCADFDSPSPGTWTSCQHTVTRVPPPTSGCTEIEVPGTYEARLDASDFAYDGVHVDRYCFCMSAGQQLDAEAVDPDDEWAWVHETFLFGPTGVEGWGTAAVSGPHVLVVTGRLVDPMPGVYSCILDSPPLDFSDAFEDYTLTVSFR